MHEYRSASTSRTLRPSAQLFTIQAVSKAARKPLAQPVPIGQKGCIRENVPKSDYYIKKE